MATGVLPNFTAKLRTGFGSDFFRPNAKISLDRYRLVITTEIILLFAVWLTAPSIIPSPSDIFQAYKELIDQGLIGELWASLVTNFQVIFLSTVISLTLAYASTIAVLRPITYSLGKGRFLSLAGLTFVFTLWLGGGHPLKVALLTYSVCVFFVTSMMDTVLQVPTAKLDYVRTLGASELVVLREAQIFGTLGSAFDILAQNAAISWMMMTMIETIVRSEGGIGAMLADQQKHFSLSAIFALQSVFLLAGIGQDMIILWLKSIIAPFSILAIRRG